jgi:hypothetical protein
MADPSERYCLRRVQSAAQWAAYHAIRRDAIFAPLLPGQAYDESGPDEHRPGRLAHVLLHDGQVVGTVRIDLIDETQAGLRLIAIRSDLQRRGHGTARWRSPNRHRVAWAEQISSSMRIRHR